MAIASEIAAALVAYLKAQAYNFLIVTGLYIVGFAVADVPWWLLTGLLSGLLNPFPHLGPVLALGIPALAIGITAGGWLHLAYAGGVWITIQVIDGFILSPRAAGRAGVNPWLSILITIAAAFLFGPIGMLLAVPVLAVILIVIRATRPGVR